MKLNHTLLIGSALFISLTALGQGKAEKAATPKSAAATAKPAADAAAAAEKAWMMYMTPGEMQKRLAMDEGDWNEALTFWMEPGGKPTNAESKCTNKMILDGRYQESVHTGMMMGMPFEGHGTVAFDNALKTFQSTWIDNMGTGIMFLQGKMDEKTNSITFTGKAVDPGSGKLENVRQVFRFVDENTRVLEMYMTKNGKEFKNMEIKMTR